MNTIGRTLLLSLIGIGAFASASLAQITALETNLSFIPSGNYRLDPTHVSIVFSVSHYGFSQYTGTFDDIEGELGYDAHVPIDSQLRVVVDARSIDANNEMLETLLEGPDFFDAANHPDITFEAHFIELDSLHSGRVEGMLNIRGQQHPVMLDVIFNGYGINSLTLHRTIGVSATTTFSRSQWGMDAYPTMIGDEITLRIEAEFLRRNFDPEEDDSVFN